jgi:GTPase-associated protein 1, N-terminal domain type 2/GTPase-associated protein 1, middle domain
MTADAFDRLLYTDCRPGTGRGGGGGFQVQAQSSGVCPLQSKFAVSWLLYEVQNAWIVQRRPVEDFPLGFAHASGAGYGTAQSKYLGKEATGGRQGNHLADCLLTEDPELYGSIRPVQLWRSPFWRAGVWDTKDCPQFTDDLEPGPLTVDAVAAWVHDLPERGSTVLAKLVSVLEDRAGRRVVIVTDDPDEAMHWIASATLLLPTRYALDISVKVFSANPLRAEQRVVAAPAELNPQLRPGRASPAFVIDAQECICDDAEVSTRAGFLVTQLTGEGDPYDVIEVVELAARLGGGEGLGSGEALRTAWALTRPDEPLHDAEPLFQWLSGANPELCKEHGSAVAAMILESGPSGAALSWIDAAVVSGELDLSLVAVRTLLRRAELADALRGQAPPADALPPAELGAEGRRDAESELASAILDGSGPQIDLLLRLARRHRVELEIAVPALREKLRDFAVDWIDRPTDYRPDGWALRETVLDCAHDELHDRMARNEVESVRHAVDRLHPYFARDRLDMSDPLDRHIQAAAIHALPPAERKERLLPLLAQVARLPAASAAGLQQELIRWKAVNAELALIIVTELPRSVGVEPEIAKLAAEQLDRMTTKKVTADLLDQLAGLEKGGQAPPSGRVAKLLAADKNIRTFAACAVDKRIVTSARYLEETIGILCRTDSAVVKARLDVVLAALLECPHPDMGGVVLCSFNDQLAKQLIKRWASALSGGDQLRAAAWCVDCLSYPHPLMKRHDHLLRQAVRDYANTLDEREYQRWDSDVRRNLRQGQGAIWESVFRYEGPKPRSLWINRSGGQP